MIEPKIMSCSELAQEIGGDWQPNRRHARERLVYLSDHSRLRIAIEEDHNFESMGKILCYRDGHPNDNAIEFANELNAVFESELSAAHLKQLTLKFAEQLSLWQMEDGQRNDLCGEVISAIIAMPGFSKSSNPGTKSEAIAFMKTHSDWLAQSWSMTPEGREYKAKFDAFVAALADTSQKKECTSSEEVERLRLAAGIELEESFESGSKWCVGDEELIKLIELAKAEGRN